MAQGAEADRGAEPPGGPTAARSIARQSRIDGAVGFVERQDGREHEARIATRLGAEIDERPRHGADHGRDDARGGALAPAEARQRRHRQGSADDGGQTVDPDRAVLPQDVEPSRIQEVVVVVRDAPEHLAEPVNLRHEAERPGLVEAEVPGRGRGPEQEAKQRRARNGGHCRAYRDAAAEPGPQWPKRWWGGHARVGQDFRSPASLSSVPDGR